MKLIDNSYCSVTVYAELLENTGILDSSSCLGKVPISQIVLDSVTGFSSLQGRHSIRAPTGRFSYHLLWATALWNNDPVHHRTRSTPMARGMPCLNFTHLFDFSRNRFFCPILF
jgi:hypothetical protein